MILILFLDVLNNFCGILIDIGEKKIFTIFQS